MAWDKTRPDGSIVAVSQADDLIRENNDSLETAMDVEHAFATGGTQTGRHQFGFGTVAARDAIADLLIDGAELHRSRERCRWDSRSNSNRDHSRAVVTDDAG